jgi:cell division protein FtsQ
MTERRVKERRDGERHLGAQRRLPFKPVLASPPAEAGGPGDPGADLALPSDEPFLRPKRRTRARRLRRGALGRVVLGLQISGASLVVLVVSWSAYAKVMANERLKVARVEVRGGRFLSEGEVRELIGPAVGENILGLDIEALKGRLRASPWVAEAAVTRALPDTLRVEIRERVPLALAELERLYLMDGDGTLIDLYGPRTAAFDLPIVRGLARLDQEARRERAERAGALLRDLGDLAAEVSEVEVEQSGDLRVVMRGAGEVLRMGPPPCRERLATFLGLRQKLLERCPQAEYFDLRFRDRMYANCQAAPSARDVSGPSSADPAETVPPALVGPPRPREMDSPEGKAVTTTGIEDTAVLTGR